MDQGHKHHFLVIAAASRGARFFVKKALEQGHSVTALCRAADDSAALKRMETLLANTTLAGGGMPASSTPGSLRASSKNILEPETYQNLLSNDPSIDRVCCFVGVTSVAQMMSKKTKLYTQTMAALCKGMQASRWVEFYYHGSSGIEGAPGQGEPQLPDNFRPKWLMNLGLKIPAAQDCFKSESILAEAAPRGLVFVIFRPAWLTDAPAKRHYGYSFDTTGYDNPMLPLAGTKTTIGREDVAEEILRVATLPTTQRSEWFGRGVYITDLKN